MTQNQAQIKKSVYARWEQLKTERSSWEPVWRDISRVMTPRRARFLTSDANKGDVRNRQIIDNTATIAARTLSAGLMSGITSPARPWFKLALPDQQQAENSAVAIWLEDVARIIGHVFNRSNLYNALHRVYEELAPYGVAAMIVHEDRDTGIYCETLTIGQYWLATNTRGIVDVLYREHSMTTAQMVEEFVPGSGDDRDWSNVSEAVKTAFQTNRLEQRFDVLQAIEPNPDYAEQSRLSKNRRYRSVWLEKGAPQDRILRMAGYDEFPAMCPRWDAIVRDAYGDSPGMIALGDAEQLQDQERFKSRAIEKMVDPPLLQSGALSSPINDNPRGVTIYAPNGAQAPLSPLVSIQPRVMELQADMDMVRSRIRNAFFADLWLMITNMERSGVTATEIDARREEKMLVLGPVLETLHHELLDPLIERVFSILSRAGMIPPAPDEMGDAPVQVEYTSILAQAQKAVATNSIEQLVGFAGNLIAVDPSVINKVDFQQAVDEYSNALGAPRRIVRSDQDVQKIEDAQNQARAEAQQKQEAMQAMQIGAQSAKVLSEADTGGRNALTDALGGLGY